MTDGCVRDDNDEHDDDYANNNDAFLPHTIAQNFTSCCVCVCLYVCMCVGFPTLDLCAQKRQPPHLTSFCRWPAEASTFYWK